MKLALIDAARLRLVQAATDNTARAALPTFGLVRVEPDGSAAATDNVLLVHATGVFQPFDGPPMHLRLARKVPKAARSGVLAGGVLTLDSGEAIDAPDEARVRYPDYQRKLADILARPFTSRPTFGVDVKRLHELASAHPEWPRVSQVQLRHQANNAVTVELGLAGVRALLMLVEGR